MGALVGGRVHAFMRHIPQHPGHAHRIPRERTSLLRNNATTKTRRNLPIKTLALKQCHTNMASQRERQHKTDYIESGQEWADKRTKRKIVCVHILLVVSTTERRINDKTPKCDASMSSHEPTLHHEKRGPRSETGTQALHNACAYPRAIRERRHERRDEKKCSAARAMDENPKRRLEHRGHLPMQLVAPGMDIGIVPAVTPAMADCSSAPTGGRGSIALHGDGCLCIVVIVTWTFCMFALMNPTSGRAAGYGEGGPRRRCRVAPLPRRGPGNPGQPKTEK